MKGFYWRAVPLGIFAFLGGLLWRGLSLDPHALPSVQVGRALPDFRLPILGDFSHQFTPKQFQDRMALLNVFASWCTACTEEQPFLLKLQREGVNIFGLSYKDSPKEALNWLEEWGNPYRMVGLDQMGNVGIDLGVYGTPETFLIDKFGVIRARHAGPISESVWQEEFMPQIQKMEQLG